MNCKRLAEKDVENFRPDLKSKLGIDYGFDQIAQGTVWLMSVTGFISVERGPMPSEDDARAATAIGVTVLGS